MAVEQTLCILKPEALKHNIVGEVCAMIEARALRIVAAKMTHMQAADVEHFYAVHRERPFFPALIEHMSSGPVLAMVLEGEDAIANFRTLMGATRPEDAEPGTIRREHIIESADSRMLLNVVHGSDSLENARMEVSLLFQPREIFSRS